jgi:hypothetical protein
MGRDTQYKDDKKSIFAKMASSFKPEYIDITNSECRELFKLAKGEESKYLRFEGKSNRLKWVFGIVSTPVILPLIYITALPAAMISAVQEGLSDEKMAPTNKKPKTPNRDIM